MAGNDVFSVIERIRTDEAFARKVAVDGEAALDRFGLTSAEQTAIVLAFQRDLEEELPEVSGFADAPLSGLRLTNLIEVGRTYGAADGSVRPGGWQTGWSSGWIEPGFTGGVRES